MLFNRQHQSLYVIILTTLIFIPLCIQSNLNDDIPHTDFLVPLFAAKDSHHVHVYIGSPPQRRIVIVDTGSRLLVFPCEPCKVCGTKHISGNYFDPKISSTDLTNDCNQCVFSPKKKCTNDQCVFHQAYTEGSSMDGYEMEDITWLGTQNVEQSIKMYMHMAVPMTFGCQTSEKGLIATQFADGIMGLSNRVDNIITKMYRAGSIPNHAFSLCLTRSNGVLSMGGTSSLSNNSEQYIDRGIQRPIHLEEMRTVPISKHHGYYSIQIVDFHVGNFTIASTDQIISIFNNGKGTIVDSGTTDTYLPKQIAKKFQNAWLQINKKPHSNSRSRYTYAEYNKLPNITLTLENGYRWTIQPDQYMEDTNSSLDWNQSKEFYNRIYLDEPNGAVLGANAMFNHDILFDLENKMIGVAASNCG